MRDVLPRDSDGRVFLDVNPKCFEEVVDYLNDCKITPTDCSPKMPHLGEEDDTALQQLILSFGLRDDGMEESKSLHRKPKLGMADDSINNHTKASSEEWKVMKFDHLSKETPHDIKYTLLQ